MLFIIMVCLTVGLANYELIATRKTGGMALNPKNPSGPYGKGYPRGKKMAAGPPYGRLGGGPPAGHIRVGLGGTG
jgi:hypothetical protein